MQSTWGKYVCCLISQHIFWHNFLSTALLPPNFYPEKSDYNVQKILPHLDISVSALIVRKVTYFLTAKSTDYRGWKAENTYTTITNLCHWYQSCIVLLVLTRNVAFLHDTIKNCSVLVL